jgi:hypothetical protein
MQRLLMSTFSMVLFGLAALFFTVPAHSNERQMSRQEVLATFERYEALNADFLSSVGPGHGRSGKSYALLREEVETYGEEPYYKALSAAKQFICAEKDGELLKSLFGIVIATSNSASEVPALTLGHIFVCQPDLVEIELRKLSPADQREIYNNISFGFENVVHKLPKGDDRVGRLRMRLKAIDPKVAK